MKLHKLRHDPAVPKSRRKRLWCGPSTLAAITGISIEEATEWFKCQRGTDKLGRQLGVKSVYRHELDWALHQLGYKPEAMLLQSKGTGKTRDRETVAAFLRRRTARDHKEPIVLSAGGHLNVVFGAVAVDCVVGPDIIPVSMISRRRARMRAAYRIHELADRNSATIRAMTGTKYPEDVAQVIDAAAIDDAAATPWTQGAGGTED